MTDESNITATGKIMDSGAVLTPIFRIAPFTSLFQPTEYLGKTRYRLKMLFVDPENLKIFHDLYKSMAKSKRWGTFKKQLKEGDDIPQALLDLDPTIQGLLSATSSEERPPSVYNLDGKTPITDQKDIRPGTWARAILIPRATDKGEKSINFFIMAVQKIRDGVFDTVIGDGSEVNSAFSEGISEDQLEFEGAAFLE